ncbi:hypothetical protein KIW84_074005 [Lathyrus oleraceus]|uniref:Uncharacterized protein n=1 Tax=Pisum sativum TaxID=3888 RepID=A0A9D4VRJ8_PEA|nr:hypothetical protein KIW84_074005 [Pisum sativum]
MMPNMEGFDDEGVKNLDDSEDERTTDIIDGFDGIDGNLPINQQAIVVGYLGSPPRKLEGDDYFSDGLDNSYPDEFDGDEGPKFEKFRNEQLNTDYKFKWGQTGVEPKKNKANISHVQTDVSHVQVDGSHVQVDGSHVQVDVGNIQDDASHVDADVFALSQAESSVVQASRADSNMVETSQTEPKYKKIQKPIVNLRKRKSKRLKMKLFQKPINRS